MCTDPAYRYKKLTRVRTFACTQKLEGGGGGGGGGVWGHAPPQFLLS